MKTSSKIFMAAGIALMIIGPFIFGNLKHMNVVDSHTWTYNINGIKSFSWVTFTGGLLFVLGWIFYISSAVTKGRRYY